MGFSNTGGAAGLIVSRQDVTGTLSSSDILDITISAVNTSFSVAQQPYWVGALGSGPDKNLFISSITSSTNVRLQCGVSNSNASNLGVQVLELSQALVKSVQYVTMSNSRGTAAVSAVDVDKVLFIPAGSKTTLATGTAGTHQRMLAGFTMNSTTEVASLSATADAAWTYGVFVVELI